MLIATIETSKVVWHFFFLSSTKFESDLSIWVKAVIDLNDFLISDSNKNHNQIGQMKFNIKFLLFFFFFFWLFSHASEPAISRVVSALIFFWCKKNPIICYYSHSCKCSIIKITTNIMILSNWYAYQLLKIPPLIAFCLLDNKLKSTIFEWQTMGVWLLKIVDRICGAVELLSCSSFRNF